MATVFSGMQPTGEVHLGNYLGAVSRWVRDQAQDQYFCVVDLHAITIPIDPQVLRARGIDLATWWLAAGLNPDVCTIFVQSQVREHSELAWILNCVASMGELNRMTQFKDKAEGKDFVSVGLFGYPVLQAADILLYHTEEVPVGADQRQHIELARDIAQRFNSRFGDTFTLPKAVFPAAGARIMDLQNPDNKMSKSADSPQGTVLLAEDEAVTRKKIMRAVTDSGAEVRATPVPEKQAVANLLDMLSAVNGSSVEALEQQFDGKGYGDFKGALADAVNDYLRPVRERYTELKNDPGAVEAMLRKGAEKAREVAGTTMATVRERVGLSA